MNDKLTCIEGTRTFWHHLIDSLPGAESMTTGTYPGLADYVETKAAIEPPDCIIRNAAYFRSLNVDPPVISFVQDILSGAARQSLIETCEASRAVVFNSEYTKAAYPELHPTNCVVIPIGTDDGLFRPGAKDERIPEHSVLWIGSGHQVKGFDLACRLAEESERPWIFVMKDDTPVDAGVLVLRRIQQKDIARLASTCAVGVCTSEVETQHLAGIEMGMCGLPLVTTNVGAYYEREAGWWGQRTTGNWASDIDRIAGLDRDAVRAYWQGEGFGLDACLDSWRELVKMIGVGDVLR